jgi:hypothetical protein
MYFILEHFLFFSQITLICLSLIISGYLLNIFLFGIKNKISLEEKGLFGFIVVGFIALIVNFFLPLNLIINNVLFFLIIVAGIFYKFFEIDKIKLIKNIILISLLAYIFTIYSTVNRPDAFLYHLPYSNILNDHKIILGLSNLHHRFAHISIFQYISSFYVNNLFNTNGLLIPTSLLTSLFFIFTFKKFKFDFENVLTRKNSIFIFFILTISFYSFNRYSGWGNDAQVHIFYFLLSIYLLDYLKDKNSIESFNKVILISSFIFLLKTFYIITIIIPIFIFLTLKKKNIFLRSKTFFFASLLIILWLIKNLLISGCLIYPLNASCIKSLSWFNPATKDKAIEGQIWAKDWPNRLDKNIQAKDYLKDFNWLKSWLNNHFDIVIAKIFPVILFIIIIFLFFYFTKCLKKNNYPKDKNFLFFFIIFNLFGSIIWFLKFPIYRYGYSYIYMFLLFLSYYFFIKNINIIKVFRFKKYLYSIILIFFSTILVKNINRIIINNDYSMVPLISNAGVSSTIIKNYDLNNNFTHYSTKKNYCGYFLSPCSNNSYRVFVDNKLNYKIIKLND